MNWVKMNPWVGEKKEFNHNCPKLEKLVATVFLRYHTERKDQARKSSAD